MLYIKNRTVKNRLLSRGTRGINHEVMQETALLHPFGFVIISPGKIGLFELYYIIQPIKNRIF